MLLHFEFNHILLWTILVQHCQEIEECNNLLFIYFYTFFQNYYFSKLTEVNFVWVSVICKMTEHKHLEEWAIGHWTEDQFIQEQCRCDV